MKRQGSAERSTIAERATCVASGALPPVERTSRLSVPGSQETPRPATVTAWPDHSPGLSNLHMTWRIGRTGNQRGTIACSRQGRDQPRGKIDSGAPSLFRVSARFDHTNSPTRWMHDRRCRAKATRATPATRGTNPVASCNPPGSKGHDGPGSSQCPATERLRVRVLPRSPPCLTAGWRQRPAMHHAPGCETSSRSCRRMSNPTHAQSPALRYTPVTEQPQSCSVTGWLGTHLPGAPP
jgi:hypothetical protein